MNDFIFDFDGSIPEFDIVVQHVSTEGGGGGQTIEVDSELSTTSNNPVKNKVITTALNGKVSASQLATVATSGSYNDLTNKPTIPSSFPVDVELDDESTNPVQNKVITEALGDKMDYPGGGTSGQVLQKTAEGAQWASIGTPSQEQIYQAVTAYIAQHPDALRPLSPAVKAALLQIAEKVAYIDEHGEDYYDALDAALNATEVISISAVFTQGSAVIYDTDTLDSLKQYLVVTATYDDGTTADVTATCSLSGTLTEGTSAITATYQGVTDTFNVTVSHRSETLLHAWDFTQSLVDSVGGLTVALYAGQNNDAPVQTSNGIEFTQPTQRATFSALGSSFNPAGKIFEYKLGTVDFKGSLSYHVRHFMFSNSGQSNAYGLSPLVWRSGTGWACYSYSSGSGTTRAWGNAWPNITGTDLASVNYMSGKTVRIAIGSDKHTVSIYIDGTLIGTQTSCYFDTRCPYPMFGGGTSYAQSSGDQCYDLILKEFNIYELPEE